MRLILRLIAALVIIGLGAAAAGAVYMNRFLDAPANTGAAGIEFQIRPGASFRQVSENLAGRDIIGEPWLFRLYARWTGEANTIQAGDYLIKPGATPRQILDQFINGVVRLYSFTLIEGWNQWDLLRAIHQHPQIEAALTAEDWPGFLKRLGAETEHPEGLFLPETYHFPRGTSDREVLQQAYELMQQILAQEWAKRDTNAPVSSPYETLILASIVEKETARVDERPMIAGVFARRLQKRMRLQTDPTVIYGIGPGFDGNLRRKDLQTDTPYNTYTRGGLPPTPIAMPGRAAIHAVLHPSDGKELFFVATGLDDGSHTFSETKAQHDAAVALYLQRLRDRRNQER
jgi:UPF0755 protein